MRRRFLWYLVILLVAGCAGPLPDAPAALDPTATLAAATPVVAAPPTIAPTEVSAEVLQAVAEAAVAIETEAPAAVAPATFLTVTVQPGDTLLGLAIEHGVPMAAIQLQNELGSSTVVRLGQSLVIPPRSAWEGASMFWAVHVVSAGETLSEIAQAYGLTLAQLQGTNGLANADLLSIGQTLVLPLTDFVVARAPEPPPAPAPTLAPTATPAVIAGAADEPGLGDPVPTATPAPPAAVAPPAPPAAVAPPPADINAWPHEVARIMNEVRASHGLPPLTYNETLARAAQIQANDCSARRSCSHTGSDGSTIKDRVLRVGYAPASWAECWAIRPSPQGAIDIWMNETPPNDPHRRTLLTTWLTEIGIGVAPGPWNATYVIAVFGRPLR
jgi:uncharacterized protein YkwD